MITRITRGEIIDVLGAQSMRAEVIIRQLKTRYPKMPIKELGVSVRRVLSKNPAYFDHLGDTLYRVKDGGGARKWSTKSDFIRAHLHLPVSEVIALGKAQNINLSKGTVYTVRCTAARDGEDTTIAKSTVLVRAQASSVAQAALIATHADSLNALLDALLDEAMATTNIKERITAVVRERIEALARNKVELLVRDCAKDEIRTYFNNI